MKKLLITIIFVTITLGLSAQKPFVFFGHVSDSLFTSNTVDRTIKANGTFLWSLDAVIGGFELNYNSDGTGIEGTLISGVGMAAGYKHYKQGTDGPISNWGVDLGIMTKVKINETIQPKLKMALLGSYYNLMAGPVYTPSEIKGRKFGLLVGANINF